MYGLEVDDAAFIRGQVESAISRMVNLMDMTERQTVRGLWHDATLGGLRETPTEESIATAVDLIGATDARVPLLVKSVAIIHVCHAAKGLPPENIRNSGNPSTRHLLLSRMIYSILFSWGLLSED